MESFSIALPVGGGSPQKSHGLPLAALHPRRCRSECAVSTAGDWDSGSLAFALSRGSCRAIPSASSSIPCFSDMLLSPRLSPSGKSDDPEAFLRASPDCVRDSAPRPAAHTFIAHGSRKRELYRKLPFHQLHGLHRGQLTHSLATFVPLSPPSSSGPWPCTRLSRVPTTMPHLTACWALEFRMGFPIPTLHPP